MTLATLHDESIDQIIVRSTTEGIMIAGDEIEVEITLSSATDTSERPVPDKWSVAHVYYASSITIGKEVSWKFLQSFVVEPGSGGQNETLFVLPDDNESRNNDPNEDDIITSINSSQTCAIRVSYGYSLYTRSACASEGLDDLSYLDVDDLVFEVAQQDRSIVPTSMPTEMSTDYFPDLPNDASNTRKSLWIVLVSVAVVQLYVSYR